MSRVHNKDKGFVRRRYLSDSPTPSRSRSPTPPTVTASASAEDSQKFVVEATSFLDRLTRLTNKVAQLQDVIPNIDDLPDDTATRNPRTLESTRKVLPAERKLCRSTCRTNQARYSTAMSSNNVMSREVSSPERREPTAVVHTSRFDTDGEHDREDRKRLRRGQHHADKSRQIDTQRRPKHRHPLQLRLDAPIDHNHHRRISRQKLEYLAHGTRDGKPCKPDEKRQDAEKRPERFHPSAAGRRRDDSADVIDEDTAPRRALCCCRKPSPVKTYCSSNKRQEFSSASEGFTTSTSDLFPSSESIHWKPLLSKTRERRRMSSKPADERPDSPSKPHRKGSPEKEKKKEMALMRRQDSKSWTPKMVRVFDNGKHKMVVMILPSHKDPLPNAERVETCHILQTIEPDHEPGIRMRRKGYRVRFDPSCDLQQRNRDKKDDPGPDVGSNSPRPTNDACIQTLTDVVAETSPGANYPMSNPVSEASIPPPTETVVTNSVDDEKAVSSGEEEYEIISGNLDYESEEEQVTLGPLSEQSSTKLSLSKPSTVRLTDFRSSSTASFSDRDSFFTASEKGSHESVEITEVNHESRSGESIYVEASPVGQVSSKDPILAKAETSNPEPSARASSPITPKLASTGNLRQILHMAAGSAEPIAWNAAMSEQRHLMACSCKPTMEKNCIPDSQPVKQGLNFQGLNSPQLITGHEKPILDNTSPTLTVQPVETRRALRACTQTSDDLYEAPTTKKETTQKVPTSDHSSQTPIVVKSEADAGVQATVRVVDQGVGMDKKEVTVGSQTSLHVLHQSIGTDLNVLDQSTATDLNVLHRSIGTDIQVLHQSTGTDEKKELFASVQTSEILLPKIVTSDCGVDPINICEEVQDQEDPLRAAQTPPSISPTNVVVSPNRSRPISDECHDSDSSISVRSSRVRCDQDKMAGNADEYLTCASRMQSEGSPFSGREAFVSASEDESVDSDHPKVNLNKRVAFKEGCRSPQLTCIDEKGSHSPAIPRDVIPTGHYDPCNRQPLEHNSSSSGEDSRATSQLDIRSESNPADVIPGNSHRQGSVIDEMYSGVKRALARKRRKKPSTPSAGAFAGRPGGPSALAVKSSSSESLLKGILERLDELNTLQRHQLELTKANYSLFKQSNTVGASAQASLAALGLEVGLQTSVNASRTELDRAENQPTVARSRSLTIIGEVCSSSTLKGQSQEQAHWLREPDAEESEKVLSETTLPFLSMGSSEASKKSDLCVKEQQPTASQTRQQDRRSPSSTAALLLDQPTSSTLAVAAKNSRLSARPSTEMSAPSMTESCCWPLGSAAPESRRTIPGCAASATGRLQTSDKSGAKATTRITSPNAAHSENTFADITEKLSNIGSPCLELQAFAVIDRDSDKDSQKSSSVSVCHDSQRPPVLPRKCLSSPSPQATEAKSIWKRVKSSTDAELGVERVPTMGSMETATFDMSRFEIPSPTDDQTVASENCPSCDILANKRLCSRDGDKSVQTSRIASSQQLARARSVGTATSLESVCHCKEKATGLEQQRSVERSKLDLTESAADGNPCWMPVTHETRKLEVTQEQKQWLEAVETKLSSSDVNRVTGISSAIVGGVVCGQVEKGKNYCTDFVLVPQESAETNPPTSYASEDFSFVSVDSSRTDHARRDGVVSGGKCEMDVMSRTCIMPPAAPQTQLLFRTIIATRVDPSMPVAANLISCGGAEAISGSTSSQSTSLGSFDDCNESLQIVELDDSATPSSVDLKGDRCANSTRSTEPRIPGTFSSSSSYSYPARDLSPSTIRFERVFGCRQPERKQDAYRPLQGVLREEGGRSSPGGSRSRSMIASNARVLPALYDGGFIIQERVVGTYPTDVQEDFEDTSWRDRTGTDGKPSRNSSRGSEIGSEWSRTSFGRSSRTKPATARGSNGSVCLQEPSPGKQHVSNRSSKKSSVQSVQHQDEEVASITVNRKRYEAERWKSVAKTVEDLQTFNKPRSQDLASNGGHQQQSTARGQDENAKDRISRSSMPRIINCVVSLSDISTDYSPSTCRLSSTQTLPDDNGNGSHDLKAVVSGEFIAERVITPRKIPKDPIVDDFPDAINAQSPSKTAAGGDGKQDERSRQAAFDEAHEALYGHPQDFCKSYADLAGGTESRISDLFLESERSRREPASRFPGDYLDGQGEEVNYTDSEESARLCRAYFLSNPSHGTIGSETVADTQVSEAELYAELLSDEAGTMATAMSISSSMIATGSTSATSQNTVTEAGSFSKRSNGHEVLKYLDDIISDLLCLRAIRMRVMWLEDFSPKEQELTHYFYYLCMREVLRRAKTVVDSGRLLDFKPLLARGDELEMVLLRTVQRRHDIIAAMASRASRFDAAFNRRRAAMRSEEMKISERLLICCDERIYALFVLCYRRWEERDKQPREKRNPLTIETAETFEKFCQILCKYVKQNSDGDIMARLENSGYLPYLQQKVLALNASFCEIDPI